MSAVAHLHEVHACRAIEQVESESLSRIRNHPFIVRAHQGRLAKEEVLRWIFCAGRESRTFPLILENMLQFCKDEVIRAVLVDNLRDEHGNGNPEHAHFQHYLHLLDRLGVSRQDFEQYAEHSGIKLAIALAHSVSRSGNLPRALGYMLVNEGMTHITYSAVKSAALQHFPELQTTFFDLHIEVDETHVRDLHRAVTALPLSTVDEVLYGVAVGERGMAVLLDEVIGTLDGMDVF